MGRTVRALVIEIPGTGLPGTQFTLSHPGVTVEIITEGVVQRADGAYLPMLLMIRGASRVAIDDWLDRVAQAYGRPETLRRDDQAGTWIGRASIKQSDLKSPGVHAILQFQGHFAAPWFHAEGGVLLTRAIVNASEDPYRLARQMASYLAECRIDAQVDVQEVSNYDFSVWEHLVQYSLGLST